MYGVVCGFRDMCMCVMRCVVWNLSMVRIWCPWCVYVCGEGYVRVCVVVVGIHVGVCQCGIFGPLLSLF